MTLVVRTAHLSYRGKDRMDVTRSGAERHMERRGEYPIGATFAPGWTILRPALAARNSPREAEAWALYSRQYRAEMERSQREDAGVWHALLTSCECVTLVCFCPPGANCHRTLLAMILGERGADVRGERPSASKASHDEGPLLLPGILPRFGSPR